MMSDEQTHRHGAFFGRRKGHPLRSRQAELFETLLPRLAVDVGKPAPNDLAALFPDAGRRRSARNRFRRRRAPDRARAGQSAHRLHRRRAVRQRHGEGAGGDRRGEAHQRPPASRRRGRPARLAAGRIARPDRPALSRPVAEAAPLEAALRQRRTTSRGLRACCAPAANSASRPTGRTTPNGRSRAWCARRDFAWTAERADDWRKPWPDFTQTRYEAKAIREGRVPCYLRFRRN